MRQQVDVFLTLDADAELDTTLIKNCIQLGIDNLGEAAALVGDIKLYEEAEIYSNRTTCVERKETLQFQYDTAHLPDTMEEALPYFRDLISQHHNAMMMADEKETMRLRQEARNLARRLNNGNPDITACPESPGCVLEAATMAAMGTVPQWGEVGEFVITVGDMSVRIQLDGLFGASASYSFWLGVYADALQEDKPFISETGRREFVDDVQAEIVPGITPDEHARRLIDAYIAHELGGKLVSIKD